LFFTLYVSSPENVSRWRARFRFSGRLKIRVQADRHGNARHTTTRNASSFSFFLWFFGFSRLVPKHLFFPRARARIVIGQQLQRQRRGVRVTPLDSYSFRKRNRAQEHFGKTHVTNTVCTRANWLETSQISLSTVIANISDDVYDIGYLMLIYARGIRNANETLKNRRISRARFFFFFV